jgi:hypothetical protein
LDHSSSEPDAVSFMSWPPPVGSHSTTFTGAELTGVVGARTGGPARLRRRYARSCPLPRKLSPGSSTSSTACCSRAGPGPVTRICTRASTRSTG